MTDSATKRFIQDYMSFNSSLKIPHPYFQQIQYIKVNSMIIKEVLKRRHLKILDVGSGAGHLINGLSAVSKGCVALDIEYERSIMLREKNPSIDGVCADVDKGFPFKGNVFDVIIASELLEHLNDPNGFFNEISRLLKDEGTLVLTTPNSNNLTYRIVRAMPKPFTLSLGKKLNLDMKLHPGLLGEKSMNCADPHVHKVEGYSKKELFTMGKEHGLKVIFLKSFGIPIPDKTYSRLPNFLTKFIVRHIEDHFPGPLRHLIVYEKQINTRKTINA